MTIRLIWLLLCVVAVFLMDAHEACLLFAMAITHNLTLSWQSGEGASISKKVSATGGQEINISESVPDSSTDLQITCNVDVSALKSLYIVSDKDMTLETNSGSTPTDTLSLKAGVPIVWESNMGTTNPLTADVTALFATTGAVGAAILDFKALQDPTP